MPIDQGTLFTVTVIVFGLVAYLLLGFVAIRLWARFVRRLFQMEAENEHDRGHPEGARRRERGLQSADRENEAGEGEHPRRCRR